MNIEKFFKKNPRDKKYASSLRRSNASAIDIIIVTIFRLITVQTLGIYWINVKLLELHNDFKNFFGTATIKDTPAHINFVLHHPSVIHIIFFLSIIIFIGAAYHAALNSSAWQATIGKRLMGIVIVTEKDEQAMSFWRAMAHYFLSIAPLIFIVYILAMQVKTKMTLTELILGSDINLLLSIAFLLWIQPHLFTKKKTTSYDLICKTVMIHKKTSAKFPWSK